MRCCCIIRCCCIMRCCCTLPACIAEPFWPPPEPFRIPRWPPPLWPPRANTSPAVRTETTASTKPIVVNLLIGSISTKSVSKKAPPSWTSSHSSVQCVSLLRLNQCNCRATTIQNCICRERKIKKKTSPSSVHAVKDVRYWPTFWHFLGNQRSFCRAVSATEVSTVFGFNTLFESSKRRGSAVWRVCRPGMGKYFPRRWGRSVQFVQVCTALADWTPENGANSGDSRCRSQSTNRKEYRSASRITKRRRIGLPDRDDTSLLEFHVMTCWTLSPITGGQSSNA